MVYCLDTNCFIEAWNKYYSPDFFKDYWVLIDDLAKRGIIYIPEMVKVEIDQHDDQLKDWLSKKTYFVKPISKMVQDNITKIFETEGHRRLVDSSKGRSMADPWVIAHALSDTAVVVTKEEKVTDITSERVKIPNVCENMGVRCINDFAFIREISVTFKCESPLLKHGA